MDEPDFFQPGTTYTENRPYAAPETMRVFDCRLVAPHPVSGALLAFGFGATAYPGDNWSPAAIGTDVWGAGWVVSP